MERLRMAGGIVLPELDEQTGSGSGAPSWVVVVYNNDRNTYEEVIEVLMTATGCNAEEAIIETWEIDHLGKSSVHFADAEECQRVAAVIATIGIRVEVREE